jgi:hypothetical protein
MNEGKLEKKQVGVRVDLDLHLKVLKGFGRENDEDMSTAYVRALEEAVRNRGVVLDLDDMKRIEKMVEKNTVQRMANRAKRK